MKKFKTHRKRKHRERNQIFKLQAQKKEKNPNQWHKPYTHQNHRRQFAQRKKTHIHKQEAHRITSRQEQK